MALISIIVPVYNAGYRLKTLLDSLCNQTLHDINIICVLDCPTDGSDNVVMSYSERDKRVIPLVNTINIGIAASRNRGIDEAIQRKSQYIGFADHDDYLEVTAYESMLRAANALQGGADVVFANSVIEYPDRRDIIVFNETTWEGIIKSIILPMESKQNPNYLARSVWNRIYKTSFIVKNNIRFFDRNIYFEEDTLFNLQVHAKTKSIKYMDECVYHWVKHPASTSEIIGNHDIESDKILRFLILEWRIISINALYEFKKYFHIMLSQFMRKYYSVILKKNDQFKNDLAKLLRESSFPILGQYENMKVVSKIRIKLLLLVFKLKTSI